MFELTSFVMMVLGVCTFILIMFLPALLELKRPKDAGPRKIMDGIVSCQPRPRIASLEIDEEGFDRALVRKVSEIMAALPNLEV